MQWTGRYALYGGSVGSGKSLIMLYDPFRQIKVETERFQRGEIAASAGRSMFFRRTMPELREVMDRAERTFKLIDPGIDWSARDKTYTFSCGYKYMFGQMEDEDSWIKYYGFEFTHLSFDELCTFTEQQYDQMCTRVRSADPVLKTMLAVRAATNPVGIGVSWVRRRFVEVAPPNTPVRFDVSVEVERNGVKSTEVVSHSQIFIPASLSDNPSLDQADYAATLSTKSDAIKRALLKGDWYVVEGAFLSDCWDQTVHVVKPFKLPDGWPRFRACRFAHSWPGKASVQWFAVDTEGNYVVYRSLTVTGHDSEMLAYRIRELEIAGDEWDIRRDQSKLTGPLDDACWAKPADRGPTVNEVMRHAGVFWQRGGKNTDDAPDQLRIRLRRRTAHATIKDEFGRPAKIIPGIRWFTTCHSTVLDPEKRKIKTGPTVTLPILPADKNNPDVPDAKADVFDYDCVALAVMYRPLRPDKDRLPEKHWDDDDEPKKPKRPNYWAGARS